MINTWKNPRRRRLVFDLIAILLGMSLTVAFAPYEVFPLAVMAPAGLFALWLSASPKRAFWLGFLFGLGFFGTGVYWVYISIHFFGDVPIPIAVFITSLLVAFLALFPATVGYLSNRYFPPNNATNLLCAAPAIWVFSEWARSFLFTGFPWLFLGYSQTNSPLKGYASILGVYGVTLALTLSSAFILNAALTFKQKNYRSLYLNLFAVIAIWTAGALFSIIPWTKPIGHPVSVSLVQGNIPQSIKWSPEHVQLSFDRYRELTEPLLGKSTLIIWPEAAIPMPILEAQNYIDTLDAKARASGSHVILGIPIAAPKGGYYNAVVTLGKEQDGDGYARHVYVKRRLVPFGEYTPLSNIFSNLLQFMNIPMSDIVAGNMHQNALAVGNLKILTSICYEIAYPELFDVNDRNISMMLTVTNDAWFGKSNAEAQHLQIASMRAIELGRPALFASNDGITAIINPQGQITNSAQPRETVVLTSTVQPVVGLTPWMRNGMDPILFILLCLLAKAYLTQRKKIRQAQTTLIHQEPQQ